MTEWTKKYTCNVYTTLDPGEYQGVVKSVERSQDAKRLNIILTVEGVNIFEHINLFSTERYTEEMMVRFLSAVATATGICKLGDPFSAEDIINKAPGRTASVVLKVEKYKGRDGDERESNKVARWIPRKIVSVATSGVAPATAIDVEKIDF